MIELLLVAEQLIDEGAYDRAEVLFTQVSQADPRNAIAVAGLARVALARGDRDRAFDEARRALTIDPEEVAAQRLINELIATAEAQDDGADPGQDSDPVPPATWSVREQTAAAVEAGVQIEAEADEARSHAEAAAEAREQAAAAAEARAQAWALAQAGAAEARAQAIAKARVAAAEARAEATAVAEAAAAEAAAALAALAGQRVIPKSAGTTPEPRSLLARLLGLFGIPR